MRGDEPRSRFGDLVVVRLSSGCSAMTADNYLAWALWGRPSEENPVLASAMAAAGVDGRSRAARSLAIAAGCILTCVLVPIVWRAHRGIFSRGGS